MNANQLGLLAARSLRVKVGLWQLNFLCAIVLWYSLSEFPRLILARQEHGLHVCVPMIIMHANLLQHGLLPLDQNMMTWKLESLECKGPRDASFCLLPQSHCRFLDTVYSVEYLTIYTWYSASFNVIVVLPLYIILAGFASIRLVSQHVPTWSFSSSPIT